MTTSIKAQCNSTSHVGKLTLKGLNKLRVAFYVLFAALLFAPNAYAEPGKTVLVMDASGSMWGKISDGYKIRVARDVVNNLLETLPADQEIGLVTYGHRETGSCDDIEVLVPPAAGTREAIATAIDSLDPKGRTPLSAAVIRAADELGFEQSDATVILISDGKETCSMDPCAVAFELEKRGIDFIAHVVGFDVEKKSDQAQLQCLAENTGGLYFSAKSGSELTSALNKISLAMAEAAMQVKFRATVQDHENTPVLNDIEWTLTPIATGDDTATTAHTDLLSDEQKKAEELQVTLKPGRYTLSVTRNSDGVATSLDLDLTNSEDAQFVLTLPPITVSIGEVFDLEWEGPGDTRDLIAVADSVSPTAKIISVFTASVPNTTTLRAPTEPGQYELRYVYAAQRSVIATALLNVVEAPTTLDAQDQANAGYFVPVDWQGPNDTHDAIVITEVGSLDRINETGTYLGNPAMVQMPSKPGDYELHYVLHQDRKVLASRPITVVDGAIKLNAPDEAGAGYSVNVDWVGPGAQHDAIVVAEVGAVESIDKVDTNLGNPATIQMPAKPGEYELRYVLHNGLTTMATRRISVVDGGISIKAPEEALAGDSIFIEWVGPGEQRDAITVAEVGAADSINSSGTYLGNPVRIQMPAEPGNYELRYVLHNGGTTLATRPIRVIDAGVNLDAPEQSNVGETIVVHWTGPNEPYDVIAVAEIGSEKNLKATNTYLGNPTELTMPSTPGDYEIRYVLHQGQTVMASQPITVNDAQNPLDAPDEANAGDSVANVKNAVAAVDAGSENRTGESQVVE